MSLYRKYLGASSVSMCVCELHMVCVGVAGVFFDLSSPLQQSPAKSNMRREREMLTPPAVILCNRHSICVIRRRETGHDELTQTHTHRE